MKKLTATVCASAAIAVGGAANAQHDPNLDVVVPLGTFTVTPAPSGTTPFVS